MGWFWFLFLNRIYQSPLLLSLYKFYKALLRLTTHTTEIYRISNSTAERLGWHQDNEHDETMDKEHDTVPLLKRQPSLPDIEDAATMIPADAVYRIDRSILYSKVLELERRELESSSCNVEELTDAIMIKKAFPLDESLKRPAACVLHACLSRIASTYQLMHLVNERAHTKYDSTNPLHEQKLLKLWKCLMPDTELEARMTRQWGEIGFQGNDPATDFRGMGLQGLDDLVYYASTHPESAQQTFLSSRHPVSWYPFAIVGINISQYAVQTLRTRQLQYYLFKYGCDKKMFSEFYCYLYHKFNAFWIAHDQPRLTVMEFEAKFKEFKTQMNLELSIHEAMPLTEWLAQEQQRQQEEEKQSIKQHVE
ncbi:elmo domain-containing protein 2 [Lichtheimia corymbifera JMRC:FSU:9682]|uniref:Elmo domain-containing protein 2 n=1 Tax=Lichtheimia corymbifera JMRC:FSU:9682 TaxID=1263082 RepID=A0A068RSW7_9FUNG|nr:elmo domain-containing protein 2 [Lichtheimia corymbifera JMRC:FSU:9682]